MLALALAMSLTGCGPRVQLPPLPVNAPGILPPGDAGAVLARQLAPTLYLQRDETFPLLRVAAVVHPSRRVIAYYLLWERDVVGRWSPFSHGPDEEELWVGYDSTYAPTDLWTYWHGVILHADWRGRGQVLVEVQWGKHGSLPYGARLRDLPPARSLYFFYGLAWVLPDLWMGRLSSPGPLCFCHSFQRYLEFTRPVRLVDRIDVVARTANPDDVLRRTFGAHHAHKPRWPWSVERSAPSEPDHVLGQARLP